MYGQTTTAPTAVRERVPGDLPVPAGPLRTVAMNADVVARRSQELAMIARDLEASIIGARPQKDPGEVGRAVPPRDTFTDHVNGALDDTLQALNALELTLTRVREAL